MKPPVWPEVGMKSWICPVCLKPIEPNEPECHNCHRVSFKWGDSVVDYSEGYPQWIEIHWEKNKEKRNEHIFGR